MGEFKTIRQIDPHGHINEIGKMIFELESEGLVERKEVAGPHLKHRRYDRDKIACAITTKGWDLIGAINQVIFILDQE